MYGYFLGNFWGKLGNFLFHDLVTLVASNNSIEWSSKCWGREKGELLDEQNLRGQTSQDLTSLYLLCRRTNCTNLKLFEFETARIWNCSNLKLFEFETARIWNSSNLKLLEFEIARIWNCSILKLLEFETVWFWNCLILSAEQIFNASNLKLTEF